MRLTRRELASAALSSAAAAHGQVPVPGSPEEELEAARGQVRRNAEATAKVELPMATEPACIFKP